MKPTVYLGIDQTGAIDRLGKPRPLAACALQDSKVEFFYLKRFHPDEIRERFPGVKCYLIIDCVLGLPDDLCSSLSWREVILQTLEWDGFGRKVAANFFRALGGGSRPRRAIELQLGANSVFQEHPFQKNIQTGTFRFWKEIAFADEGFHAPWVEGVASKSKKKINRLPIYEGYPTLIWKKLLRSAKRDPAKLGQFLKAGKFKTQWTDKHQAMVEKDSNLADAFVLALAGEEWLSSARKRIPHPEGWILGGEKP